MHIYKFTHIETGRCYIGQTIQDPNRRRLEHIADSRYTTKEYHFHNAIRKYGVDRFTFEVIAEATSLDELNLLEEQFIIQYNSINNGFNIRNGGGNKLHSEESKERMREGQRAAHARRREAAGGVEKTRPRVQQVKGWKWTDEQKEYLKEVMKQKKLEKIKGASV